jgi:hypothetical protein
MFFKTFRKYAEIPLVLQEYILTVSGRKEIGELTLTEINDYLAGLEDYHVSNSELNQ